MGNAPPVRLQVQDEVEGWTVTRIEAKRVTVQSAKDVVTIRMDPIAE